MLRRIPSILCRGIGQRAMAPRRLPALRFLSSNASSSDQIITSTVKSNASLAPSAPSKDADILAEQLQRAKNVDRILELVVQHHRVMNNAQVLTAFTCLHDSIRQQPEQVDFKSLTSHPGFRELCNRALKRMRYYEAQEVLSLLKLCTLLQIPTNTALVQAIGQMLKHSINSLTLSELIFVDMLLQWQKSSSSITDALKIAIPLVFQAQLPIQLDFTNIDDVVRCFKFAYTKELDPTLVEKLAVSLLSQLPNLDPEQAATIVITVGMNPSTCFLVPCVKELLRGGEQVVADNLSSYAPKTIRAVLASFMRDTPRTSRLLEALVHRSMDNHWPLSELSLVLDCCYKHEYATPCLSEYLAERIIKEEESITQDKRVSVVSFADLVAACPKQTDLFREAARILTSCQEKIGTLELVAPHIFARIVTNLARLHCFPKELLERAFDEQFLNKAKFKVPSKKWPTMLTNLLQLEQCARIDLSEYQGPVLPDRLRKEAIAVVAEESSLLVPLKKCLEVALGGAQFVAAGLWTRHSYFIDFAVVMRKGEYPMAVSTQMASTPEGGYSYIEDLRVPEDAKILVVLTANYQSYWRHTSAVKGSVVTKLRHLATLGYHPLLVNIEQWKSLPDYEKIPYVMREAKAVLSEGDASWSTHAR
ncbi:FAST kinase domain-containing protein 2, mitochondrial-like isoform X2 [Dermacentor albipictus]